jgi:hypothetical protein
MSMAIRRANRNDLVSLKTCRNVVPADSASASIAGVLKKIYGRETEAILCAFAA